MSRREEELESSTILKDMTEKLIERVSYIKVEAFMINGKTENREKDYRELLYELIDNIEEIIKRS